MGFVAKAIGGIGKAIGLVPKTPKVPAIAPVPTMSDAATSAALDAAAAKQAAAMQGGRTSTMLTGGAGEDETQLKTSKILLGQ